MGAENDGGFPATDNKDKVDTKEGDVEDRFDSVAAKDGGIDGIGVVRTDDDNEKRMITMMVAVKLKMVLFVPMLVVNQRILGNKMEVVKRIVVPWLEK